MGNSDTGKDFLNRTSWVQAIYIKLSNNAGDRVIIGLLLPPNEVSGTGSGLHLIELW